MVSNLLSKSNDQSINYMNLTCSQLIQLGQKALDQEVMGNDVVTLFWIAAM